MSVFTTQIAFVSVECLNPATGSGCGFVFAVPVDIEKAWRNSHRTWHCPSCQREWHFTGKSEIEKLERELGAERNENRALQNSLEFERKCVAAQKGAKTKLQKRIAKGVCPCCNRTFKQLARHMKTKHPDYIKED